ncbi:alpha/beta hydrolase [Terrimonas alba]|uniref:alpha/beta hydrolase n=1 Tax=Terrimonas alba TaxID=3349636 RepID=UPI0035F40A97
MASTQSKLFNLLLRLVNKKRYLRRQLISGKPSFFDRPEPTRRVKRTCRIQKFRVNGRNVFTLAPKNKPAGNKHILYLHGGAYVQNFNIFHWRFLAQLVQTTGCSITAPDYPYAPAYSYQAAFDMVSKLYRQLISKIDPNDFILMGDSAGGGFALALAQKMRDENIVQANRIILLSPWLDITLTNPGIAGIEPNDRFLDKQSLMQAGQLYAGDTDRAHYLLSPVNGSLNGLGRISVFMGSKDILAADTRKLAGIAAASGIKLDYYEYEDMAHAWMFLNFPESKKAKRQIFDLVQQSI